MRGTCCSPDSARRPHLVAAIEVELLVVEPHRCASWVADRARRRSCSQWTSAQATLARGSSPPRPRSPRNGCGVHRSATWRSARSMAASVQPHGISGPVSTTIRSGLPAPRHCRGSFDHGLGRLRQPRLVVAVRPPTGSSNRAPSRSAAAHTASSKPSPGWMYWCSMTVVAPVRRFSRIPFVAAAELVRRHRRRGRPDVVAQPVEQRPVVAEAWKNVWKRCVWPLTIPGMTAHPCRR